MDTPPQPLTNAERSKRYRDNNHDKVRQQNRDYYNRNREAKQEYQRQYRADHKNDTITCPCGSTVVKRCISNHRKTQKHIRFTNGMNNDILKDQKYLKLRANALVNLKKHCDELKTITDKKQNKSKWRTIYAIIQKYNIKANEFRHARELTCDPSFSCKQCRPDDNNNYGGNMKYDNYHRQMGDPHPQ